MIDTTLIQDKPYYKYAQDVLSGKQVACEYIKCACQRFFNDLNNKDFLFGVKRVDRVLNFMRKLTHPKGPKARQPIHWEPWQEFIVANVYGFYHWVDNDVTNERYCVRVRNTAYLELARKNAKTTTVSAFALFSLVMGDYGEQVCISSNTKEEAMECFDICVHFAKDLDPQGKYLKVHKGKKIEYAKKNSWLKVVAADSEHLDGMNLSCAIIDEYHAAKTNEMKNVLESSQTARLEPLMFIITTAGFNKDYPCYDYRNTSIEILKGIKQEDSRFAAIYTLDEDDIKTNRWETDRRCWQKCSPNYGISIVPQQMLVQVEKAKNTPSERVGVLTKTFNIWCDVSECWISDDYLHKSMFINGDKFKFDWNRYKGRDVYASIDLASVSDLTAISFMVWDDEWQKFVFKVYYFLPEETIKTHSNREFYKEMVRCGFLQMTPGNVVDYAYVLNLILTVQKDYDLNIVAIAYDRWNSTSFVQDAEEEGLNMCIFSQTIANFNFPTKMTERLFLQGGILMDCNFLNLFCFRNCEIMRDSNGNEKVTKKNNSQLKKVDGAICVIQCLGQYYIENDCIPKIFDLSESTENN